MFLLNTNNRLAHQSEKNRATVEENEWTSSRVRHLVSVAMCSGLIQSPCGWLQFIWDTHHDDDNVWLLLLLPLMMMMIMIMRFDELYFILHLPSFVKTNHNYKFQSALFLESSLLGALLHRIHITECLNHCHD